ncbi:hypothetical protein HHI36_000185, partial [Cryptolaemus montrouzieri]
ALSPHELQELGDKLNLEESYSDGDDELEEKIISGENVDGDPRPDEFDSSNAVPLSHLIPDG